MNAPDIDTMVPIILTWLLVLLRASSSILEISNTRQIKGEGKNYKTYTDWVLMFGGSKIHHLQCTTSDHSPLWIMPDGIEPPRSTKPFRFEEMWLADKGCSDTVLTEWWREDMDIPGFDVTHKIDRCGKALTLWSQRCFGNVRKDL